jgi:hypothetical protein
VARDASSFSPLSQSEKEAGWSRICLGIHWAFDSTEGIKQGKRVADYAFLNILEPRRRRYRPIEHPSLTLI